jgi:hypothetical protein
MQLQAHYTSKRVQLTTIYTAYLVLFLLQGSEMFLPLLLCPRPIFLLGVLLHVVLVPSWLVMQTLEHVKLVRAVDPKQNIQSGQTLAKRAVLENRQQDRHKVVNPVPLVNRKDWQPLVNTMRANFALLEKNLKVFPPHAIDARVEHFKIKRTMLLPPVNCVLRVQQQKVNLCRWMMVGGF